MRGAELKRSAGVLLSILAGATVMKGEVTVDFEDLPLTIPPMVEYTGPGGGLYYNGSDLAGGFESGGVFFENDYNAAWMSWSGWAYSTTSNTETAGEFPNLNEWSPISGSAAAGAVHAVAYSSASILFPQGGVTPLSMRVTNVTYPYISMRDGDAFAGEPYGEGDFFKLILTAYAADDSELGTVEYYLADFRPETEPNVLLSEWATIDLSGLNGGTTDSVMKIGLGFESSRTSEFGGVVYIDTPTYVAVDELVLDGGWAGYLVGSDGWADTGAFLGWVYPVGDFVWIQQLGKWVYLPEGQLDAGSGVWINIPR